ncbi:MAG: hypothetical protein VKP62_00585 [Candidatus Sericytochromatia bacterium]|nr:hypothetical protein [Candidatus Sericytochromatia bacterium]
MGALWRRAWRLLQDLSGETALRQRLARADCGCRPAGVRAVWEAQFGGVHRCC